ncbi:MAG TPA: DUF488 domain-containing protein [Syntrophales bacterium]|nr:DUF488 domain-containing protein [Syntrophales bacterium]HOM08171.1 DUF488 domain-containing protein [Syntrophales bacterium]HON99207.1 DUF488 domain-containing protein [Syntrophales bacterium]HPC00315.1 DUF488 domain-containing protein [Syntrophales bacterium]HPQ05977.1 DUF488 domain-containing protein [Syntrophales bacterium]
MKLYTIGFTKKTAREFFSRLTRAGVTKVVDVRLNNSSQLAGFAKKDDLAYFLEALCGLPYEHRPELAPTEEIRAGFKGREGTWEDFEKRFLALMAQRRVAQTIPQAALDGACLLCSEDEPRHCHRRLVAEYLRDRWGAVEIVHL